MKEWVQSGTHVGPRVSRWKGGAGIHWCWKRPGWVTHGGWALVGVGRNRLGHMGGGGEGLVTSNFNIDKNLMTST